MTDQPSPWWRCNACDEQFAEPASWPGDSARDRKILEDQERAIEDYTRALRINPRSARTYSNRGVAYSEKGQLGRAARVLRELDLDIPAIGLAKKLEEVFVPGRSDPIVIPRGEEALYLLQRVRDEAHRFAIAYHRTLRGRSMVDSILDGVTGIGTGRKQALIKTFGSVKRMRGASVGDLADVVPDRVAAELYEALHEV